MGHAVINIAASLTVSRALLAFWIDCLRNKYQGAYTLAHVCCLELAHASPNIGIDRFPG